MDTGTEQLAAELASVELPSRRGRDRGKHVIALVIASGMAALLTVLLAFSQLRAGSEAIPPLAECINPNTASVGSLVRLPGLGITRANAIISYRDTHPRDDGRPVFRNCEDMEEVSGIGPVTAANICPHLKFE